MGIVLEMIVQGVIIKEAIVRENYQWRNCPRTCLYVLIMSRTRFRVNLYSIVAWMLRSSLLKTGAISEVQVTASNGIGTHNYLVCKRTLSHLAKLPKCPNWLVWLSGSVFIYKLRGCGFKSSCSNLFVSLWLIRLVIPGVFLNIMNKSFLVFASYFTTQVTRTFYVHKWYAQKEQYLSPRRQLSRVQLHGRLYLKFYFSGCLANKVLSPTKLGNVKKIHEMLGIIF